MLRLLAGSACLLVFCGCAKRQTLVDIGDHTQEYRVGNSDEPSDLDPHTAIGELEHYIMVSLFEGLVVGDPKDVSPRPGVAERWDISPDGRTYTFHLRKNARWSNGDPVTARDFLESYRRILTPSLAAQYSYMLYPVTNAEAFNTGKITNFDEVGFKAPDDLTFEIKLRSERATRSAGTGCSTRCPLFSYSRSWCSRSSSPKEALTRYARAPRA